MSARPGKAKTQAQERRQRRFPRFRTNFPVGVTLLAGTQYRSLEAHCKDLSAAGIGLLVATELNSGEVASLSFSLPGTRESLELRAVLRHRRGYHYGFEFLSLTSHQNKLIAQHLTGLDRAD
jgi:hypothetical protein